MIHIIGMGSGRWSTVDEEKRARIKRCELIIGASRLLTELASELPAKAEKIAAVSTTEIMAHIFKARERGITDIAMLCSGDSLFYSGATPLVVKLEEFGLDYELLPGYSAVQLLAARLGRPWQDWRLVSAHGRALDPVKELAYGQPVFMLTGGQWTPKTICEELSKRGFAKFYAVIGENLGLEDEKIHEGTVAELAESDYGRLAVILIAPSKDLVAARRQFNRVSPGLPDSAFKRGEVPMTKQEVRAVALSKLAVTEGEVAWDIGAGTGSVSVELALQGATVFAVERKPEACELVRQNAGRLSAHNLELYEGEATSAIESWPKPDLVFIGGSGGKLKELIQAVFAANSEARVCITAIALETLNLAITTLKDLGYEFNLTQLAVSRNRQVGQLNLLMAENPTFIITVNCRH